MKVFTLAKRRTSVLTGTVRKGESSGGVSDRYYQHQEEGYDDRKDR